MAGIDISEIIAQFGAFYRDNGQNQSRLIEQLRINTEFEDMLMSPITTTETSWQAAESTITEILQGYQPAWTPKGTLALKPIEHILRKLKADIDLDPHEISYSWAGFLEGMSDVDAANWPIVRWAMERKYIPQMREDRELKVAFNGVYVAPTPGTANPAAEIVDGVNQLRKKYNALGRLGVITLGAVPTDPVLFVKYIQDFAKEVDSQYRRRSGIIAMSDDNVMRYKQGFRELYGASTNTDESQNVRVLDTGLKVHGFEAMGTSNVIFTTPKDNLKVIRKAKSNDDRFKIESIKRTVSIFNHSYICYGANIPEVLFTNEEDLV